MAEVRCSFSEDFEKCVEFHGHICPGLAIGFQAARVPMERLGVRKAGDEELVAIVENDACGVDAIQVLTGCTFGKGNLIFRNYGKHAFTLAARNLGKTVRVCLRPDALEADPEHISLMERVNNDEAVPGEMARFRELHGKRAQRVLEADTASLFTVEEISAKIPARARIGDSGTCDLCGELTQVDLLREIDGKKLCIPCAGDRTLEAEDE